MLMVVSCSRPVHHRTSEITVVNQSGERIFVSLPIKFVTLDVRKHFIIFDLTATDADRLRAAIAKQNGLLAVFLDDHEIGKFMAGSILDKKELILYVAKFDELKYYLVTMRYDCGLIDLPKSWQSWDSQTP
jgi:hypothetical protein